MYYLTLNGEIQSKCPDLNVCLKNYDIAVEQDRKFRDFASHFIRYPMPKYDVIDDDGRSYINL